jgi:hypothetical protein
VAVWLFVAMQHPHGSRFAFRDRTRILWKGSWWRWENLKVKGLLLPRHDVKRRKISKCAGLCSRHGWVGIGCVIEQQEWPFILRLKHLSSLKYNSNIQSTAQDVRCWRLQQRFRPGRQVQVSPPPPVKCKAPGCSRYGGEYCKQHWSYIELHLKKEKYPYVRATPS